jgi:hypothetical protein
MLVSPVAGLLWTQARTFVCTDGSLSLPVSDSGAVSGAAVTT